MRVRCAAATPHRMRLALDKGGRCRSRRSRSRRSPTERSTCCSAPITVSPRRSRADPLLRHKTTRRADYDRGWREAEAQGAFDTLFFNERGELTEGGRSNVFVKLEGRWWTPPIASGVLPGVMRGVLLDDADMQAAEQC